LVTRRAKKNRPRIVPGVLHEFLLSVAELGTRQQAIAGHFLHAHDAFSKQRRINNPGSSAKLAFRDATFRQHL
jgi:hypothetical protein